MTTKMEANDRKLGKSLEQQGHSVVVMYRAVGTNVTEFFDKDYVTLSKKFAIEHAEHNAVVQSEPQHVIKKVVMGKNVFDAYNPGEYFYSGPTVKGKVIYKTSNEMEAAIKPTILKNPSITKLKALIKNAQYNELKGLISGPDVYWWNQVEDWHHSDQYEKIGRGADPTKPMLNNPNYHKDRLVMMYINDNPNEIALVNNDGETPGGAKYILDNPYLRKLIAEGDLWIDNPDVPFDRNNVDYIRGVEYMNKHNITAADFNELLCWIDADGKEIEVTGTDATHAGTFRRLCKDDSALNAKFEDTFPNFSQNNVYIFCTRDLGWIRISGHGRYVGVMITKNRVSSKAVSTLGRILKDYDYDNFILEYHESYNDDNNVEFYKLSDLMTEIRKNVGKELVASYAGTGEYGYWLHDGKVGEVEHQQHDVYLRKHFSNQKLGADPWVHGFKQGWIRAVNESHGNLSIELWYGFVDRGAFKALSELINKRNAYKGFIVEVSRGQGKALLPEHLRGRYFMFKEGEERKVLHLVRQCLKPDDMTAIDDVDYGWWITEKGNLLKVDFESHNTVSDKYIKDHFYKEYLEWVQENDTMDSVEFALTLGFIRLVAEGEILNVEIDKSGVTREAYRALSKFYNDHYFDRINLDIGFQRRTTTSKRFSAYEDNLNKFLPFMRTYIRKSMEAYDDSEDTFEAWITDKAVVPSPFSHVRTLNSIIAKKKKYTDLPQTREAGTFQSNEDAYEYGTKLGWIRIVGKPFSPGVNVFADSVHPNAYKLFYSYFNERVEKDAKVTLEIMHDDPKKGSYKEYPSKIAVQNVKKNIRKDKTITASEDPYGYWITADGKLLKVPTDKIGHIKILEKYADDRSNNLSFTDLQWEHIRDSDYWSVLGKGWIRISIERHNTFNVEIIQGCVSREAYKKLVVLLKSKQYNGFLIDIRTTPQPFDYDSEEYERAGQLLAKVEQNVSRDKTIVAIDGDNNVTGRYSQIAIEQWKPDNSVDQIQLLNIGQDFVIRTITGSETSDLTPFKFVETARKALLDMVRDMERAGIIYKKQAVQPIQLYATDETVVKRWETGSGKHAITLVQDQYGYSINNFVKLPSGEYKKDGTSYLGKADIEQALKKINEQLNLYKNVDGTGFKEVRVGKVLENLVPKKEAQKTAQVTVRGKVQDNLDGFTKFSKQPEVPGLTVYVKKVGSNQYAKIVHDPSKLVLVGLTKKPLSFSPSELVERIDLSPLKNYNWMLPQDQLFKKYGPSVLASAAMDFTRSLDLKKMDKTDQALEGGLKNWVKDWLIAIYFARPAAARNLKKQIDSDIQKNGLNKNKVFFYYGDPSIKSDEVWKKIGLVRTGTSSPYKYEFADKVPQSQSAPAKPTTSLSPVGQAIALIQQGSSLDAAVRQVANNKGELDSLRRDVKLEIQRSSRIKQETGDKLTQKQGDYTWATVAGRARKSEFSFSYKGTTIGSILVPDANLVKTLQSFGNTKVNPEYFDSPYLKKLHLERSPNYGINLSYDLYSDKKKVGIIYSPTPEIFGIIKRINAVADTPPIQTEKPETKSAGKSGMIGSYVTGTDRFGDKVTGILLTEKRDPKTYKSAGTAVIIDDDGAPVKVKLTGVRRKLTKAPAALTKAYKMMTASLRLEASGKTKEELRALNKGRDTRQGYHSYRLKIGKR